VGRGDVSARRPRWDASTCTHYRSLSACWEAREGSLLLNGTTTSPDGIATPFALQQAPQGGLDVFVAKLDPQGARRWGTYYGGGADDITGLGGIASSGPADIVLAGNTTSPSGITTDGALVQPDFGGSDTAGTATDGGCGCRETPVPRDISLLALALLAVRRRKHATNR